MLTVSRHERDPRPSRTVARTPQAPTVLPAGGASRPRRRGRTPLLLDAHKRALLLAAVTAGHHLSAAARLAGVSPKAAQEWMRRGEGRDARPAVEPYTSFVQAVEHAQAEAEAAAMATITTGMRRNPRWAVWWLEHMVPEWRPRRDPGEVPVPVAPPAPPQRFIRVSGETLRRLAAEVRAERGEAEIDDATVARRGRLASDSP